MSFDPITLSLAKRHADSCICLNDYGIDLEDIMLSGEKYVVKRTSQELFQALATTKPKYAVLLSGGIPIKCTIQACDYSGSPIILAFSFGMIANYGAGDVFVEGNVSLQVRRTDTTIAMIVNTHELG